MERQTKEDLLQKLRAAERQISVLEDRAERLEGHVATLQESIDALQQEVEAVLEAVQRSDVEVFNHREAMSRAEKGERVRIVDWRHGTYLRFEGGKALLFVQGKPPKGVDMSTILCGRWTSGEWTNDVKLARAHA